MATVFGDFDVSDFWCEYDGSDEDMIRDQYLGEPLTDEVVAAVERELGYRLPRAYVELMKTQNGGMARKTRHRTKTRTTYAGDHIAIVGLFAIGRECPLSLCGAYGSKFWMSEWDYPDIGVYFADCPSAGHDMVCLDYRDCAPEGEPRVVHVDQEIDYRITVLAENFEAFIRGLESEEAFAK